MALLALGLPELKLARARDGAGCQSGAIGTDNRDRNDIPQSKTTSIARVNLVPTIMKGIRAKKSYIFTDKVDHSGISKVCGYLAVMYGNAVEASDLCERKCFAFWNKKIMLQAVPQNAELLSRALATDCRAS